MSAVKRLITNTMSMFIAQGIQPFLSILLVFIIGRTLGPEIFGKYTIIFQIFSIFQITCSLGLKTLLTREVAIEKENVNKYLVNGSLLSIPASIFNIGIVALALIFLNYESDVATGTYVIALSLIASALTDVFSGILSGFEEIKKLAYAWIIFLAMKTFLSISVLLAGYGLFALILVHVATKFIQSAIIYLYIFKLIGKPKLEIDINLWKKLIRMGWSLALLAISVSLFWRIDAIMLSKMVSNEQVGNFGAAYKIFHFMLMTVRSFSFAFFPMISSMYVNRERDFRKACRKAIRYLTILVLPITIIISFSSPQLMPILWGDKFDNSIVAQVLQVMSWSLIPFAVTEVFGSALIASRNQMIHVILNIIVLIIKIILNYYLTLKYGVVGPAISTLIALFILFVMQIPYVIPKLLSFRIQIAITLVIKMIIVFVLMVGTLYFLKTYHFVIGMTISGVIYAAFLFILRIVSNEDKNYFRVIIKKAN